jgi:hypothetical protein
VTGSIDLNRLKPVSTSSPWRIRDFGHTVLLILGTRPEAIKLAPRAGPSVLLIEPPDDHGDGHVGWRIADALLKTGAEMSLGAAGASARATNLHKSASLGC